MINNFEQRCLAAFPVVAFIANRHLIDHMRRMSAALDMDIECALLWGLVAHMNVARSIVPGAPASNVMNADGSFGGELHPVKLADVTLVSGLPRETVRRKLELLKKKGRIDKTPDGSWIHLESGVDEQTIQYTMDNIRRLIVAGKEIEAVLSQVNL